MAFISNGTTVASGGSLQNVPAPTNSQILSGVASTSVGAVGSYAQGKLNATKNPGDTFSGNSNDYQYGVWTETKLPSGTWRVMGKTYSGNDAGRVTVVLRVS